jgi:hypothetical protein
MGRTHACLNPIRTVQRPSLFCVAQVNGVATQLPLSWFSAKRLFITSRISLTAAETRWPQPTYPFFTYTRFCLFRMYRFHIYVPIHTIHTHTYCTLHTHSLHTYTYKSSIPIFYIHIHTYPCIPYIQSCLFRMHRFLVFIIIHLYLVGTVYIM